MNKENILNWDVAALLVANSLAWVMPVENNALLLVILIVISVFFLISSKSIFALSPLPIIIISLFVFIEAFLRQTFVSDEWDKYLLDFIALGIPSLYIARSDFSPNKVLVNVGLISIPLLPFIFSMNLASTLDYGKWMGVSYGVVSFVIALLYDVFFQSNNRIKHVYKCILFVIFVGYIAFYIQYASRGSIIAVLFAALLFFYVKYNIKLRRFGLSLVVIVLTVMLFWNEMILFIMSVLESFGFQSFALSKMLRLDDLSNGRSDLLDMGLDLFYSSPLFGHGVGIFESTHKIGYVHNCFVQFLDEGGIIFFSIMTFIILSSFRFILIHKLTKEKRFFLVFLFSAGIIQLIFSSYFWASQIFWFLIGYTLKLFDNLKKIT